MKEAEIVHPKTLLARVQIKAENMEALRDLYSREKRVQPKKTISMITQLNLLLQWHKWILPLIIQTHLPMCSLGNRAPQPLNLAL
jgi:hypothetical protein